MELGQDGNALIQLVTINAVLFVVLKFVYIVFAVSSKLDTSALKEAAYNQHIFSWFSMPANWDKLSARPWTLLTYMFCDNLVFRFIANMAWLWSFGYILQDLTGNRKLVPIYIYGGIAGALGYLLAYTFLPGLHGHAAEAWLAGANPSVIALAVATTVVAPDYRIFPMINGGMPLWILTLIFVLINFSGIPLGDSGAYIANLAGAGLGYLFILQLRRNHDWSVWMNNFFDWCNDLFNPNRIKNRKSPRDEFYYKVSGTLPFKKIPNITQQRIDEILDKINQQGYRFLTDEEKEILKRAADEEES